MLQYRRIIFTLLFMYKKVFAILALSFALTACNFGTDDGPSQPRDDKQHIIRSNDGQAHMIISDSMLPAGTTIKDISITRIKNDTIPVNSGNSNHQKVESPKVGTIGYTLRPSGLELAEEAVLETNVERRGKTFPIPLIVSGNPDEKAGFANNAEIAINQHTNQIVVKTPIKKLGNVAYILARLEGDRPEYFRMESEVKDAPVSEPVVGTITTRFPSAGFILDHSIANQEAAFFDNIQMTEANISGRVKALGKALSPGDVEFDKPASQALKRDENLTFEIREYNCASENWAGFQNDFVISYKENVSRFAQTGEGEAKVLEQPTVTDKTLHVKYTTPRFDCFAK